MKALDGKKANVDSIKYFLLLLRPCCLARREQLSGPLGVRRCTGETSWGFAVRLQSIR